MNITINLLNAFGFQGGTIHQVAELTGCDAFDLLGVEADNMDADVYNGWYSYRYNDREYNQQNKMLKGNILFWYGVALGVQTCKDEGLSVVAKF